jgi:hypothetical protein
VFWGRERDPILPLLFCLWMDEKIYNLYVTIVTLVVKLKNGGCMIVYFYDLKPKKVDYNRIKRMFYYNLKKIRIPEISFRTKSVLVVDEKHEKTVDRFFFDFKRVVEVYKIRADYIEQLY